MEKIIWQSIITEEMVSGMSDDDIQMLCFDLNDAVVALCNHYGVED